MIFPYKIYEKNSKGLDHIFCYCRDGCKAKLTYLKQSEGYWTLKSFNMDHDHDLRKPRIKSTNETISVYENYIKSLDPLPERKYLLSSMKKLYNIS